MARKQKILIGVLAIVLSLTVCDNGNGDPDSNSGYTIGTFLVQTKWGLHAPYNKFHHTLENGAKSRVGCNQVAMAQIIKYHQWPFITSVDIPAYTTRNGLMTMPEIIRNNFRYDWANMKNIYTSTEDGPEADAVATLMHHVSMAVQGNYTPGGNGGGGTNMLNVAIALFEYFNYDNNLRYMEKVDGRYVRNADYLGVGVTGYERGRDIILPDIWDEIMKLQIDSLLPVYFWGDYPDGSDGHAMVLDGYNNSGQFHFNVGENGSRDGWYATNALDLSDTRNLNNGQIAIVNIMPNLNGTGSPDLRIFGRDLRVFENDLFQSTLTDSQLPTEITTVTRGETFIVNPTIYNIGTATSPANRVLGIALYTTATDFTIIGEITLDETLTFTRARQPVSNKRTDFTLGVSSTIPVSIPAGNYVLSAVIKNNSGGWDIIETVFAYKNEITITIN